MKELFKTGIALAIFTAILALVAVWFWALFGMSTEVGTAWFMTCCALGVAAFLVLMVADTRT